MKREKKTYKTDSTLNIAIRYLSYQPRTVHEVNEYLKKKNVLAEHIHEVIQILQESRYLDDENFAKLFIQSKAKHKPKSRFALGYDLKKKGISQAVADNILSDYDDEALALDSIKKKFHLWITFDDEKFKKKVMNFLRYRGFNYEICNSTLSHFMALKNQTQKEEL